MRNLLPLLFLILSGCSSLKSTPEQFLFHRITLPSSSLGFRVCVDIDCNTTSSVRLSEQDWDRIATHFEPAATEPKHERQQIADAVAYLETLVDAQVNIRDRAPRYDALPNYSRELDCIAETINTTKYLLLMHNKGLLRHHTVGHPAHRGFLTFQSPHNTATLVETMTRRKFAVDSYFHGTGIAPEVVQLETWQRGYEPKHRHRPAQLNQSM